MDRFNDTADAEAAAVNCTTPNGEGDFPVAVFVPDPAETFEAMVKRLTGLDLGEPREPGAAVLDNPPYLHPGAEIARKLERLYPGRVRVRYGAPGAYYTVGERLTFSYVEPAPMLTAEQRAELGAAFALVRGHLQERLDADESAMDLLKDEAFSRRYVATVTALEPIMHQLAAEMAAAMGGATRNPLADTFARHMLMGPLADTFAAAFKLKRSAPEKPYVADVAQEQEAA